MTDDDDREKQPLIWLVSENPDAPDLSTRKIIRATYSDFRRDVTMIRLIALHNS